jgi:hypothetical protein
MAGAAGGTRPIVFGNGCDPHAVPIHDMYSKRDGRDGDVTGDFVSDADNHNRQTFSPGMAEYDTRLDL